jgi:hypothetical protein
LYFVQIGCLWLAAYRDKKVVGVFVRFRAPLQLKQRKAEKMIRNIIWR